MERNHKTIIAYYLGRKSENENATLLDQVICFFTKSRFSHVELVYDYSPYSQIGLTWSSSSRDGGVRPQRIDFNDMRWELYEVPTTITKGKIIEWFNETRMGAEYDWLGALGAYIPAFKGSKKRWFCSEIVATCLKVPDADKLTPQELFDYFKNVHKKVELKDLNA